MITTSQLFALLAIVLSSFSLTAVMGQQIVSPTTPQSTSTAPSTAAAPTTLFESTNDSIRVQVPDDWIIQDVDNAGPAQSDEEVRQGYGILMQLCPEEQATAAAAAPASTTSGVSSTTNTISSINASRCLGAQEVIHVIRYPDLDARLSTNNSNLATTIDNVLTYHLQKLQEVGYRSMRIVNSTDMAVNIINPQTNETLTAVPAKLVEMTYSTSFAPNEMKRGYFILTAANETIPNVGTTKGYSVFYEGNSTTAATAETTIPPPDSLAVPAPLPAPARQVLDSFELIAAEAEVAPTEPLTVEIISSDTEGEDIAPATFEFEADVEGGTEPYTYSWDFDDDDGGAEIDDETVSHIFEEAGSYEVGLTVIDSGGQTASDSMEITVDEEEEEEEEEPLPAEVIEEPEEEEEADEDNSCHPSYPDVCIPPPPPDLDCDDIDARNFEVSGSDPHGFDGNDNDGIGCESGNNAPDDGGDDDGGGEEGGDSDNGGGGEPEPEPQPEPGEGEGGGDEDGGGEGNPNEFDDCEVPPGRDPGDVGC